MRCYRILAFASVVAASVNQLDIASPRSNEAPSLVRRAELAYASPYTYIGCYTDSSTNRALTVGNPASETLVIEACAATCAKSNYTYMGVEFGQECYCDNAISSSSSSTTEDSCNTPCSGNSNEICGGNLAISVYEVGGTPDSAALNAESASYSYGYGPTATSNIPPSTWTPTPPANTTGQRLNCSDSQGAIYSFNNITFEVECGMTIQGYGITPNSTRPGGFDPTYDLQSCLQACTYVSGCVAAVFFGNYCYYKNSEYTKASPSALQAQSGANSGVIPLGSVVCPAWNGSTYNYNGASYQIQCNLDHPGYDIDADSNPGGVDVIDLQSCLEASTWVASEQNCYYKNSQWTEGQTKVQDYTCDSGVPPGAVLVTNSASSSTGITSDSTSTTSSATSSASTAGSGSSSTSSARAVTGSASTGGSSSASTSSANSATSSAPTADSTYAYGGQTYNVYLGKYEVPSSPFASSNSGTNPAYPASNDQANGITVTDLDSCMQACSTMSNCVSATWIPSYGQCLYSSEVPSAGSPPYEVDTAVVSKEDPSTSGTNEGVGSPGAYSPGTSTGTSTSATTTGMGASSSLTGGSANTGSSTTGSSGATTSPASAGAAPTTTSSSSVLPTTSVTSSSVSGSGSFSQQTSTSSSAPTSSTGTSPNSPPALLSVLPTSSTTSSGTSSSAPTSTGQVYYHNTQAGAYAPLVVSANMSTPADNFSNTSSTTPSQMIYRYLGCYTSTNSTALFTTPPTSNDSATTESCISQCAAGNYNIPGVLAGNMCGCNPKLNDTVPLNGRVDETNCNLVCPGNSTEVCGGSGSGLIGGTKYVSLYSASPNDCLFNNVTSAGVPCTAYWYLGPGRGTAGTGSNATASGSGTIPDQSSVSGTTASYLTTGYVLPPSWVYTAPLSSNTNGYSPAFGGNANNGGGGANSGGGGASSIGGAGALGTEPGQCQAPRTIVVTTDTTITVSASSTAAGGAATMNGVGAENTAGTAAAATPSYNTMEYMFRPSSMYGAANPAMSGVGYSPAVGTMSQ